jgi:hypothetical protein
MVNITQPSVEYGWLFKGPSLVILCLLWALLWFLLVGGPARLYQSTLSTAKSLGCVKDLGGAAGPTSAEESLRRPFYLRKMRRMQAYCVAATLAGVALLGPCFAAADPILELLVNYGPAHQIVFCMAVGHWAVNLWEDWETRHFLGQGLTRDGGGGKDALFPLNVCLAPGTIMLVMYFIHHVVTLFAYIFSLATGLLGGVMVQGLIFEMPVMLMLRRDIAVATDPPPAWLMRPRAVQLHWFLTYLAFAVGRLPATVLWIVSLTSSQYHKLVDHAGSDGVLVVYIVMGVFFTSLNIRILGLLITWHANDIAQARCP